MNVQSWSDLTAQELLSEIQTLFVWLASRDYTQAVHCRYYFPDLEMDEYHYQVVHVCNDLKPTELFITKTNNPYSEHVPFPIVLLYDMISNKFWNFSVYLATQVSRNEHILHFSVQKQLLSIEDDARFSKCVVHAKTAIKNTAKFVECILQHLILRDLSVISLDYFTILL